LNDLSERDNEILGSVKLRALWPRIIMLLIAECGARPRGSFIYIPSTWGFVQDRIGG
jgi:hypothetical protein